MAKIAALAVSEPVRVDGRRIADIEAKMGEGAAHAVIGLVLEQLACLLTDADAALSEGRLPDALPLAERMSRLSWQIGLLSLAGVAMDLGAAGARADGPALAAIHARLMRVGNRSLTAIWDRTAMA
ncbi:hypothetical protein Q4511_09045 [Paracoccus sp. 1_MG-2023]|uniref:hypothetical protein n=1 Tax=unclassified Paracoccus (in: a-proteobacteria) TaxID=2688777 RepID=UPI001C081C28|nr:MULTISPECIES: hypothetical protein [unclassified Paracoccus (in: a-proteobacteria)]MBU2957180.1 hypothetical protein [Paracoccus sp. C2R09]MDO6669067.1 hypothetical protein [Paracoccus sp. 1_MG-2023]